MTTPYKSQLTLNPSLNVLHSSAQQLASWWQVHYLLPMID